MGLRNGPNTKDWIDLATTMGIRFHSITQPQDCAIEETVREAVYETKLGTGGQYLSFKFNAMDASDASAVTQTETGGFE